MAVVEKTPEDLLKEDILLCDPGEKVYVYDRQHLNTEEWRACTLEKLQADPAMWRLLSEDGDVLDEPDDCPAAGFTEVSLLADCGASIEMLSQFAEEQEVLFPPNTLLKLVRQSVRQAAARDAPAAPSTGTTPDAKLAASGSARDADADDAQLPERPEGLKQRLSRWSIGLDEGVEVVDNDGKEYVSILVMPTFL